MQRSFDPSNRTNWVLFRVDFELVAKICRVEIVT